VEVYIHRLSRLSQNPRIPRIPESPESQNCPESRNLPESQNLTVEVYPPASRSEPSITCSDVSVVPSNGFRPVVCLVLSNSLPRLLSAVSRQSHPHDVSLVTSTISPLSSLYILLRTCPPRAPSLTVWVSIAACNRACGLPLLQTF
jgi:hypothetical protein